MKKIILLLIAIAITAFVATTIKGAFSNVKAENPLCEQEVCKHEEHNNHEFATDCQGVNNRELYTMIESRVTDTISGTHHVKFNIKIVDTVKFTSISIDAGNYFELDNFPLDTGVYYLPDSNSYQLTLTYNHTQLPAYFQEVKITLFSENRRFDEFIYLFFDHDSLYTWSAYDFLHLNREWIIPHSNESISFSLGEVDTFSIPAFDSLLPYQYLQVPGKSYSVPVNIDTTDLNEGEYFRRGAFKTFKGRVTGNIHYMHNNDIGVEVALKIKGIRVQIWEKTGGLMPHKLLVSGETNADGHFDLSYERTKLNFDGNIKVYIRIVNSNDYVTVSRYALNGIIEPLSFTLGNMTHNYTDGNEVTFNVGNIEAQAGDLAQIFHWASRTMEFVNSEMNGVSGFEMTHLRIFISNEWSHYNMSGSRILLNSMDITSEETVQHEIGHHIHLRILQDGSRQPSGGGTHTSTHNNSHPNQTITEGFADAVAYITDARYFADDQEANILLSGSNNHIQYFRLNIQTHPLTAEEVFARTLLDLFDDVSKFQNYGIPIGIGNWVEWINDIEGGIRNDYANFSYKEIMMPFFQNRSSDETTIQNLGQYFKQLAINTDCNRRQYIKQGMDWNLVNINNLAGFPERLSTDLIFVNQIINHRNDNLSLDNNFNLIEGTPSFYDYTYNSIDRNELNTATGSFNITNNHNGWGTNLSDPLTITDGQTLYVNNNVKSNWLNGSDFNPAQYSHVAMSFCNGATEVENGSSIMIGDWTEYSTATAHIGEGTTLKLLGGVNPSTLIINNNSKLIIEEGGILEFHPNAKIILNGPNAVLEVKGQIRLMPNADFTVEGGAQGFGYIRFYKNMNNNPKLLEGTSNNNIVLTGTGTTHRLIEIDGNEGWQIPPSITNVEISDCKITLGAGLI